VSRLKELTLDIHRDAERSRFAQRLLRGLSAAEYYQYLYNQYMIYDALETRLAQVLPELKPVFRASRMFVDLRELERDHGCATVPHSVMPVVKAYERHIQTLDSDGLLAHLYVRHFGDMYGGQIIKNRIPGSGSMYDFSDVEIWKAKIRERLNDGMAPEAIRCFEFAIQLFKELDPE
jgi:heme oxygenase (biliverdin-producing, ferredoxin)